MTCVYILLEFRKWPNLDYATLKICNRLIFSKYYYKLNNVIPGLVEVGNLVNQKKKEKKNIIQYIYNKTSICSFER